jgi:hypothetical protein
MKKSVFTHEKDGVIEPTHEIEAVCFHCGYDIDEAELEADTCSDCGQPLKLRQSVAITVSSMPLFGETF